MQDDREPIRVGVIGVGHWGKLHAEKYRQSPKAQLVAVVDSDPERGRRVGEELGVTAVTDHRELEGQVKCVSVAVPTAVHYQIAKEMLLTDIDVLLEKPMTSTVVEGQELVKWARERGLILQVGHLERFNPAVRCLKDVVRDPRFIECHRLAPFVERGTDVDVVLDLMIHDIDIMASLVPAPVDRVEAVGVAVLTDKPDIANARIRFANGCVANITASRVSMKRERKIRFFQRDAYISVDYEQKRAQVYRKRDPAGGWDSILGETLEIPAGDALAAEIDSFLESVRDRRVPEVSGEEGLRALEIATMVSQQVQDPNKAL